MSETAEEYLTTGIAYAKAGHPEEAVGLDPNWAAARERLRNLLAGTGRHDEAIAEYKQSVRLDPDNACVWKQLGVNLYVRALTKKSRPAAEAAKEALERKLRYYGPASRSPGRGESESL